MKFLPVTEFAAKRRLDQEHLEERLRPEVIEAVKNQHWALLVEEVAKEWRLVYRAEGGIGTPSIDSFLDQIEKTLEKTKGDDMTTVDRISIWLSTAILNHATVQAGLEDPTPLVFEWVTMHDSDVRETHRVVDGVQQFEGETFTVGGEQLHYPGEPVGDPSVWINCRCALAPILADQASSSTTTTEGDVVTATTEEAPVEADAPETDPDIIAVTWHGVLAPEGVMSGDGRMFAPDSLTHRDLPLPLTWQKSSGEGHSGSVTVARIETIERVDGLMLATGTFLSTPEADEVVGLLADFGRFGVSVDADDAEMELDEQTGSMTFTKARIASASIVAIPAFAEAYVSLGPAGGAETEELRDVDTEERKDLADKGEAMPDGSYPIANCEDLANAIQAIGRAKDPAATKRHIRKRAAALDCPEVELPDGWSGKVEEFVKTEDGPGWLTHPVDTDRLRDYWAYGEGAAKIAWGVPGDFDRCRVNLAKYVKPQYLNGYCANRHYDATGFWPGHAPTEQGMALEGEAAPALGLVASSVAAAPAAWFADPEFAKDDGRMVQDIDGTWGAPMRITDEGRIFGHLAKWGVCHTGFSGVCTVAPHSATGYAYFLTGEVMTDEGPVAVGGISVGGGHASGRLGLRPAAAHYDSTSAIVADVTCGEDEFGIWYAGQIRPHATEQQIYDLRAAGVLSGDWREFRGQVTELVAALAVNSPGFQTPRIGVAAGLQTSLVAAGIVQQSSDLNSASGLPFNIADFAEAVAAAIENRQKRREAMERLRARTAEPNRKLMAALAARYEGN